LVAGALPAELAVAAVDANKLPEKQQLLWLINFR
jgi:hypothetical protein